MILLDTTSAGKWRHFSGLARVSRRLAAEFGAAARPIAWPEGFGARTGPDWILSPELFSEAERPGFTAFLERRPGRLAALYHDSIPLRFPESTWPRSVARHPSYLKLLARFDRVWAVSAASREELLGFWRWQGLADVPPVEQLALGADGSGAPRALAPAKPGGGRPRLVAVGILEPRKNQAVLLDAYERLRAEGLDFELHLAGRVNPHFGRPIAARARALARRLPGLYHHQRLDDRALDALVQSAVATAFPSRAEGCGLPVLESLWQGVPCLCSAIPPVAESAAGGGCTVVAGGADAWVEAIRRILTDAAYRQGLALAAVQRTLPTWAQAAATLRRALA